MEALQPETQNPPAKHVSLPLVFASIFAVIYFLFAPVLAWPLDLVYGGHQKIPPDVYAAARMFFYPVIQLRLIVPAYNEVLGWEEYLLGMGDRPPSP
jgi:hypothetical protein